MRTPFAPTVLLVCLLLCGCRPAPQTTAPVAQPSVGGAGQTSYSFTLTDDLGNPVTFAREPQRIVTLAPNLTEMAFALGLDARIVGVTTFCKFPAAALQKPKMGGYINPSAEKVVATAPDVVFTTRGTPAPFMTSLRSAGIKVFAVDHQTYEQVVQTIERMGAICNVRPAAARIAADMRGALQQAATQTAHLSEAQRPRALNVVWLDPLCVSGAGSFQHEMLQACGVRDVSGLQKDFGSISPETVVEADPQVIVMTSEHSDKPLTVAEGLAQLRQSPTWKNTSAARQGRLILINAGHLSTPGPRLALGVRELLKALHPELATKP